MSSNNPPTAGQWPPRRPSKRCEMRNGTFIVPSTGERSRRQFTLRNTPQPRDGLDDDLVEDAAPFYTRQGLSQRFRSVIDKLYSLALRFWAWLRSPKGKSVLKCVLAYTLASLWTFVGPLSSLLGKPDGKHVVATITVYFHPARTAGSMIEAILIATVAVAYAELISVLSMSVSVLFGSVLGLVTIAYGLVLLVFVAGGFGFIGWIKQRMNNPLVNIGGTLASLAIISVLTRENSVQESVFENHKIVQVLQILVLGVLTTSTVNLLVWRVSARALLRDTMTKASVCLGDMLTMITHGFLSGCEEEFQTTEFNTSASAYSAAYGQMAKNLREAKFEHYFLGQQDLYLLERSIFKSMEALAQSIGGLRSAANTQFALLKEQATNPPSGSLSPGSPALSQGLSRSLSAMLRSGHDRNAALSAIDEAPDESSGEEGSPHDQDRSDGIPGQNSNFREPSDIFELFISMLGPSMKSLVYTLSGVLREPPFGSAPDHKITVNDNFRQSLTDALGLYNSARAKALEELYKHIELGRARSEEIQADIEEVAAACGHFSFSLQTFGEEMSKYLDVLDDLKHASEYRKRSWRWLLFWRRRSAYVQSLAALPFEAEREGLIRPIKKTATPRVPDSIIQRRDTINWEAAPETSRVTKIMKFSSQQLLLMMRFLSRDDIRFGIKVGLGAMVWAMFAFIPDTRPIYQHWRGEWGLLSFMIVCSMTVGASNTTGFSRFLGTVMGAAASVINWNISQGNGVALVFLGSLVSFWNFYVFHDLGKAPLGRTTLLAYNVSTLYAYSLTQNVEDDDDDEGGVHPFIMEIATHRAVAVTAGILWGIIVCRLFWPISARTKFREGLSMLYLQMGLIWKRGPLAILLRSDCTRSYLKSGEQHALQKYAARLESLRSSATSEFELRGPFQYEATSRLMRSTNRILDAFYAMSLVAQRRGQLSDGERALLLMTATERALLCDRICHVFQVLASSFMLEYPLTDAVPSVAGTRDRLLGKIFQFRKEHSLDVAAASAVLDPSLAAEMAAETTGVAAAAAEEARRRLRQLMDDGRDATERQPRGRVNVEERDYALLYAYALVTGQVAEELKNVEREIESMFGRLDENASLLQ